MLKRLFPALLACAMVFGVALPAKPQSAPTVFASQVLSGAGQAVTLDLGGQTTCRAALVPTGGFVGTLTAGIEAVGDSSFQGMTLYDDNGLPVTTVTSAGGYYTLYPKSAGTIEIAIATWSNGGMNVYINCSPAGGPPPKRDALGNESVTFPSAQPVTLPGVTFPTPIPSMVPVTPTATPAAPVPADPVLAYLEAQCGTAGLFCPVAASGSNAAGSTRNALDIIPCNPIATLCAPPTPYPSPSAGAAMSGAALPVTDPCFYTTGSVVLTSGNGFQRRCDVNGNTLATFPSAQPVNVMNAQSPTPGPTASAGAALPSTAPWNWSLFACQYNGYNNATAGVPPNPSIGNAIGCQSNIDGSLLASQPQINAKAVVSANGTFLSENLDGEASCRIKMNPGAGTSGVVNVVDSSGFSFAGPYTVSGVTNTATFQLVTPLYATTDALAVVVSSFAGANTIAITLTCSNAPGVESVYQGTSPWKDVLTDPGGTPWTPASPFPVITPAPVATAASPAPAGVPASGYNAAGLAAPVICTQEVSGTITTSAVVVVAAVAAKKIYVCSYSFSVVAGAANGNAAFSFGAPTTCLSPANAGLAVDFLASSTFPATLAIGNGVGLVMMASAVNKALCIKASTAITAGNYDVMYEQF